MALEAEEPVNPPAGHWPRILTPGCGETTGTLRIKRTRATDNQNQYYRQPELFLSERHTEVTVQTLKSVKTNGPFVNM